MEDVANQQHLFASEGLAVVVGVGAENAVDEVNDVCAHHGYLIDDDEVKALQELYLFLAVAQEVADAASGIAAVVGGQGVEGQLEEAVKGDASRIDGSNARRCQHNGLLACVLLDVSQEGALPRSGLTGEEEGVLCVADDVQCRLELRGAGIDGGGGGHGRESEGARGVPSGALGVVASLCAGVWASVSEAGSSSE